MSFSPSLCWNHISRGQRWMLCMYLIKLPIVLNLFLQRLFSSKSHSMTHHIKNYICIGGFLYCVYVTCVCVPCVHTHVWACVNPGIPCHDWYVINNYERIAALQKAKQDTPFTDQLKKLHSCVKHQIHKLHKNEKSTRKRYSAKAFSLSDRGSIVMGTLAGLSPRLFS